ncbi:MAG TPA: TRAP transporter large permease [Gammaproteobacteria bacterium]|nr:TRAP transporter large permease [Gammaproteobacteria bacterium]
MEYSLIGFAALLLLSFVGVPLGYATLTVGLVGLTLLRGFGPALIMAGEQIRGVASSYGLSVIPLFVLMGGFIYRANVSDDLYEAGHAWLGRLRGGLAMSTIFACAAFSAVCGSSLATAATMSRVSMEPMRRYKYDDALSTGSLAAGGTLGFMIPPSVPMILYSIVARVDLGKLFIAGILPGILLAVLYCAAIGVRVAITPELGPRGDVTPRAQKWRTLYRTWPIMALFVLVIGGIYLGVFTPTEAGAIGAFGAYVYAVSRGRLRTLKELIAAFYEAIMTTGMLFAVLFSALIFAQFVNLAGLPYAVTSMVHGMHLGATGLVLVICLLCILMGSVFESIGILVLVVPVFLSSLQAVHVDLLWFGIIVIIVVEMGLITPPIGMNVFTVRSIIRDVPLTTIFRGVIPFVYADVVALALLFLVPAIATILPRLMG